MHSERASHLCILLFSLNNSRERKTELDQIFPTSILAVLFFVLRCAGAIKLTYFYQLRAFFPHYGNQYLLNCCINTGPFQIKRQFSTTAQHNKTMAFCKVSLNSASDAQPLWILQEIVK